MVFWTFTDGPKFDRHCQKKVSEFHGIEAILNNFKESDRIGFLLMVESAAFYILVTMCLLQTVNQAKNQTKPS